MSRGRSSGCGEGEVRVTLCRRDAAALVQEPGGDCERGRLCRRSRSSPGSRGVHDHDLEWNCSSDWG
nr:hypothetical protein CFP56_52241 [Quercus suber]